VNAVAGDGVGGWYGRRVSTAGGLPLANLLHVNADGTVDPGFAPNPDGAVNALAVRGSTVYVAGTFGSIGGQTRPGLAAASLAPALRRSTPRQACRMGGTRALTPGPLHPSRVERSRSAATATSSSGRGRPGSPS